jgi:hypothetical protein
MRRNRGCVRANSVPPRAEAIPVIFITAKAETADEVQGLALGAADYLNKPVIPAIVKARVQTQLALRQARRELEKKNLILSDEKELLEDIVSRMRSASPFDERKVRHIQSSLEKTAGDIVLCAYRPDGAQHVLVGDFSGHGLTAAFGGPLVSYIFYRLSAEGCAMRDILEEVNRILCRQLLRTPASQTQTPPRTARPPDRSQNRRRAWPANRRPWTTHPGARPRVFRNQHAKHHAVDHRRTPPQRNSAHRLRLRQHARQQTQDQAR